MNKVLNVLIVLLIVGFIGYKFYLRPKFSNGANIPDFSTNLMNGESFMMSSLHGNYVLLDFWGSWCPPCRKDNPNLVQIYNDFEGKKFTDAAGFEIVSVAVENAEAPWKKAINKDGLKWKYHILQKERFKSQIPMLYGVKEIPTKYLLNPKGTIIAVNPNNKYIHQLLDPKLKS